MRSTFSKFFIAPHARNRKLILLRLAFLVPLLIAAFVLHVSGTTLIELKLARLLIVALALVAVAVIRRRHPKSD